MESMLDPALKYTVHILDLDATEKHKLRLNPKFIPSPKIQERHSHSFHLPVASKMMLDYCISSSFSVDCYFFTASPNFLRITRC